MIKQQLVALIADPGKVSPEDAPMLRDLVLLYPYFQPAHLLLAKATAGQADGNEQLATAVLYTNGALLHDLLHTPEDLMDAEFNIVSYPSSGNDTGEPEALDEAVIDEVQSENSEVADEEEVFEEIGEVDVAEFRSPILENIVATDFFAFQDNFQIEEYREGDADEEEPEPVPEPVISKYDDDKLPYTFLWWLAKTRKEHQQIFQPYATPRQEHAGSELKKEAAKSSPELQQQYVEHIFHMQSAFDGIEQEYSPVAFKKNSKGSEIIESFIKNEPQISPPKPEAINNENKARKSAEDHNDLVSETLANIYIEQMLYDKAIETYEKLSLKFPEKSRYFADLIQSLEKKI